MFEENFCKDKKKSNTNLNNESKTSNKNSTENEYNEIFKTFDSEIDKLINLGI